MAGDLDYAAFHIELSRLIENGNRLETRKRAALIEQTQIEKDLQAAKDRLQASKEEERQVKLELENNLLQIQERSRRAFERIQPLSQASASHDTDKLGNAPQEGARHASGPLSTEPSVATHPQVAAQQSSGPANREQQVKALLSSSSITEQHAIAAQRTSIETGKTPPGAPQHKISVPGTEPQVSANHQSTASTDRQTQVKAPLPSSASTDQHAVATQRSSKETSKPQFVAAQSKIRITGAESQVTANHQPSASTTRQAQVKAPLPLPKLTDQHAAAAQRPSLETCKLAPVAAQHKAGIPGNETQVVARTAPCELSTDPVEKAQDDVADTIAVHPAPPPRTPTLSKPKAAIDSTTCRNWHERKVKCDGSRTGCVPNSIARGLPPGGSQRVTAKQIANEQSQREPRVMSGPPQMNLFEHLPRCPVLVFVGDSKWLRLQCNKCDINCGKHPNPEAAGSKGYFRGIEGLKKHLETHYISITRDEILKTCGRPISPADVQAVNAGFATIPAKKRLYPPRVRPLRSTGGASRPVSFPNLARIDHLLADLSSDESDTSLDGQSSLKTSSPKPPTTGTKRPRDVLDDQDGDRRADRPEPPHSQLRRHTASSSATTDPPRESKKTRAASDPADSASYKESPSRDDSLSSARSPNGSVFDISEESELSALELDLYTIGEKPLSLYSAW